MDLVSWLTPIWGSAGIYDVPEKVARLIAALLLVLHPLHEQYLRFRPSFNRVVNGFSPLTKRERKERGYMYPGGPLSARMNFLQALALATVFPAALFGPLWILTGVFTFYLTDVSWTHGEKGIPGLSSALAALVAIAVAIILVSAKALSPGDPYLLVAAAVGGASVLALTWWTAYRAVRRG